MKTILVIGGMARSGKSTSITLLYECFNFPSVSTSVMLDEFILQLQVKFGVEIPTEVEERRKHKIIAAEEILVPIYGRESFACAAAKKIFDIPDRTVVLESIGGEEWKLLQRAISTESHWREENFTIHRFNVKRDSELSGVDKRVPLDNAYTIWNNGSLGDLCDAWENQLQELGL